MNEQFHVVEPNLEKTQQEAESGDLGVGIGLLLYGIAMLVFPKYADVSEVATDIFYGLGFLALLIGFLVTGVEIDKLAKVKRGMGKSVRDFEHDIEGQSHIGDPKDFEYLSEVEYPRE